MKIKLGLRLWILIILVVMSLLSIFGMPPTFLEKGVLITSVETNSTAFDFGFRQGQTITSINGQGVETLQDYSEIMQSTTYAGNQSVKTTFITDSGEIIYFAKHAPEITVSEIPKSQIKTGLDISGGARALVRAENHSLSQQELQDLVAVTEQRINVYGISDVRVSSVSDLSGNNFMLVELAGATPGDLRNLLEQQGKFEAKIGNETVFTGGEKDISSVGRNPPDAIIEQCQQSQGAWFCNFRFTIYLSEAAAERHADITQDLNVNVSQPGYLEKPLDLYLDDNLRDSLLISEGLKGRVTTQISISGSGSGATREEAYSQAEAEMHQLQTILVTGSLPYKLEIVKLDTISPQLGQEFTRTILIAGLLALVAASLVVFVRYRNIKSSLAMIVISFSEVIIILGIAALIEWNLDLPSIAGILATIGTGFDDQIIILDESVRERTLSLKQRLKRAFSIIFGAYFTVVVSLFPLLWAGAGLLKGFAFTTLIGVTAGVLITRPAFAEIVRKITRD